MYVKKHFFVFYQILSVSHKEFNSISIDIYWLRLWAVSRAQLSQRSRWCHDFFRKLQNFYFWQRMGRHFSRLTPSISFYKEFACVIWNIYFLFFINYFLVFSGCCTNLSSHQHTHNVWRGGRGERAWRKNWILLCRNRATCCRRYKSNDFWNVTQTVPPWKISYLQSWMSHLCLAARGHTAQCFILAYS